MTSFARNIYLADNKATSELGKDIGRRLSLGDVILLNGSVGAGKTHLARSLIQSILTQPEDIPSPTFTLVQTYETQHGELWHVDLYRITSDLEINELGLLEAFETAICIVEWPNRLGAKIPKKALTIDLTTKGDARNARLTWTESYWRPIILEVTQNG